MSPLLPGSVVGVIGGGQLGRYFVLEARRLGYQTWVLDPDPVAPAMQLAEHTLAAPYDDVDALRRLAQACDAVTVEFENVPAASLELIGQHCRVAPSAASIRIAQDRELEKQTAEQYGLTAVPYQAIVTADDITGAVESVGLPAILKTSRLGYDGKGQVVCDSLVDVQHAFAGIHPAACVLERRIELAAEISVVLARGFDATIAVFPVARNVHLNGILSTSSVPAEVPAQVLEDAQAQAIRLAQGLDYHGVLAVEFFVDDAGLVLFNEMAPRPHNSGHYTLDATVCSQFEQQLRALCGLPLGATTLLSPVCMINLLGDVWSEGQPHWHDVLQHGGAQLHLYGKQQARPGRKMGHINCLDVSADVATAQAQRLMGRLGG